MSKSHIFYRSDFKLDSEGHSYFDGLLESLGVNPLFISKVDELSVDIESAEITGDNLKTLSVL